jgi:hypothetical protein
MASISVGACSNVRMVFGEIPSRMDTWVYQRRISYYFNDVIAVLAAWRLWDAAGLTSPFYRVRWNVCVYTLNYTASHSRWVSQHSYTLSLNFQYIIVPPPKHSLSRIFFHRVLWTKLLGALAKLRKATTSFVQWRTQEFCSGRVQQNQSWTEGRENGELETAAP